MPTLYLSKGLVSAPLAFVSGTNSDLSGQVTWIKPQTKTSYYAAGFDATESFLGAHYAPRAKGLLPLDFPGGAGNATLVFENGGLANPLSAIATLGTNDTVTITNSNIAAIKFSLKVATGMFSGQFNDAGSGKIIKYSGALYQNANEPAAAGFFLGPIESGTGESGSVVLMPR